MKTKFILSMVFIMTAIILVSTCAPIIKISENTTPTDVINSINYRNGKFNNDVEWKNPSFSESMPLIWDFFFGEEQRTPVMQLPRKPELF